MPEGNESLFYRTVLKHAREKPELEDVPRVSEEDFEWSKESSPQKSIIRKESPANILRKYYGDALEDNVMWARSANIQQRNASRAGAILKPDSYSKIFEDFPVYITQGSGTGAYYETDGEMISLPGRPGLIERRKNWDSSREKMKTSEAFGGLLAAADSKLAWAKRKGFHPSLYWDPHMLDTNSLRLDLPFREPKDLLEHELGHAWANPIGSNRLAYKWKYEPYHMRDDNWNTTETPHMEKGWETVQAAGRLQREHFKATGSRLKHGEFTKLASSPEIPDYLSNEGNRLLKYAKDTIKKIDHLYEYGSRSRTYSGEKRPKEDRDRRAKEVKKHFLDRLETILPTTVKAEAVETPSQIRRI